MTIFTKLFVGFLFAAALATAEPAAVSCLVELHQNGSVVTRRLRTSEVRPLQMEVGDEAVERMLASVAADGDVARIQAFLDGKRLPAVVLPNREVRILDGHHRARLMALAENKGYAKYDELSVTVEIKRDFVVEGLTMEGALIELNRTRNLCVTRDVRRQVESGQLTWEMTFTRFLPTSVRGLKDNARRSLLGAALHELRIDSTGYRNFVEFFLAEEMEARGFEFPDEISLKDPGLLRRVVDRLGEDDMLEYLEGMRLK